MKLLVSSLTANNETIGFIRFMPQQPLTTTAPNAPAVSYILSLLPAFASGEGQPLAQLRVVSQRPIFHMAGYADDSAVIRLA